LLNLKKDLEVTKVTVIGSIVGLSLNFILVPLFKYNGTAIAWLLTEILITVSMFGIFQKNANFLCYIKPRLVKLITFFKGA
jgi:O-antigen/teichoic acid export membrane protein